MANDADLSEGSMQIPRLKFADKHIQPILGGKKTVTLRLDLDYEKFQIGRRFHLCDENGDRFASAHVDDRGYTTVEMAAKMEFDGHRTYRSIDELIEELRGYYPNEEIGPNTRLEIVYWDWEGLWE